MSHKRRRSDKRERVASSDENTPEKAYSNDNYSYSNSHTHKKHAKHKRSKKASKYHSSDFDREDDYYSKKDTSSRPGLDDIEDYESSSQQTKKKFDSDSESYERNTKYKKDFDVESCEKNSKQAKKKPDSNMEIYDRINKRNKKDFDYDTERYERSSKQNKKDFDSDGESYERSSKQNKKDFDSDGESYERNSKGTTRNFDSDEEVHVRSGKQTKKDTDSNGEKCKRSRKWYKKDFDSDADSHERSSKRIKNDISSGKYSRKKRHESEENYGHSDRPPSYYDHYQKHSKENKRDFSSDKYSRDKYNYEMNKYNEKSSETIQNIPKEKSLGSSSRYERHEEYIDLDDPNRKKNESMYNEDDSLNTKYDGKEKESKKVDDVEPLSKKEKIRNINMRTGGAYIPPAKLRMMQEKIKDKSSEEYQRIAWEALKKSINGMTNKVNSSNISEIVIDLFKENIIRGRGVLARAIMQAQGASPTFTRVYAALVAIINTKFPEIGELILKRLILQYKRGFRRNDKTVCMTAGRFLAHLLNQEVAHEILILEIVTHLLENPTEDSVEVSIAILKECGKKLTQLSGKGMRAITQRVREVLHEGNFDSRVRYMIEVFFAVQKDGFKDFETVPKELDLIEEEDKFTHLLNLDDDIVGQEMLNIFKYDPDYLENEEKYKSVVKEILGDSDDEGEESGAESDSEAEEEEEKKEESQQIVDMTETNIVCLRRKIYLTIQSSLDFEECAHKLLKLELKPGQILEMCYMILDCCAQQRTYEKFFGLLAQRFCQLNKIYVEPFTEIFENSYKTIHRLETNKLRNVAKFFAHLLYTDAISWTVLSIIKLNEADTSSSSRIFIKILFQELCEYMGLTKLNERVKDVTLQEAFDGLFPRDLPHNTRFAINFFTSIGLGGLTDELREHLKNLSKPPTLPVVSQEKDSSSTSSSSSSSSSSSTTTSSSSSDSDSE